MVFSFLRFSNKLKKVFCELVTSTTTTTTTATKERTNERRRFRFPPLLSALQQTRRRSLKCGRQKIRKFLFFLSFLFLVGHVLCLATFFAAFLQPDDSNLKFSELEIEIGKKLLNTKMMTNLAKCNRSQESRYKSITQMCS